MKVTFVQSKVTADSPIAKDKIDWFFVNDNYWAFLPFHLYWDSSGVKVQDMGMQKLPLGNGSAKLVTFKYPNGGYTPGDTWDLYVGSDNLFKEMVYHRGSPKSPVPALVTVTWAGYKKVGPLTFSTEHRGTADGKPLHLFFSNVARQASGVGHVDKRAIGRERPRAVDGDWSGALLTRCVSREGTRRATRSH